ncbi:MAG: hypothetical protein FJ088_05155 [Deltaproteobacteria bacterium]|nr:hypothetical protein [Deltaproteobacteria bacterium]
MLFDIVHKGVASIVASVIRERVFDRTFEKVAEAKLMKEEDLAKLKEEIGAMLVKAEEDGKVYREQLLKIIKEMIPLKL